MRNHFRKGPRAIIRNVLTKFDRENPVNIQEMCRSSQSSLSKSYRLFFTALKFNMQQNTKSIYQIKRYYEYHRSQSQRTSLQESIQKGLSAIEKIPSIHHCDRDKTLRISMWHLMQPLSSDLELHRYEWLIRGHKCDICNWTARGSSQYKYSLTSIWILIIKITWSQKQSLL